MATVKGVNKTKIDAGGLSNKISQGYIDGRVKTFFDQYEFAGELLATVVEVGPELPLGAKILEVVLSTDDLGNNVTLIVGDAEDPNRYITSTDHGGGTVLTTRLNAPDGLGYEIDMTTASTPDNQILVTTATAAATGTMNIEVKYTKD